MIDRVIVLCIGFILDIIFGDPYFMPHPVRFMGKLIEVSEKSVVKIFKISGEREKDKFKKLVGGALIVITVVFVSVFVPYVILKIAGEINRYLKILIEGFMCYQLIAMKSLKKESMKVYYALKNNDVEGARQAVSMIVGRDTKNLDREGITKAAVETVAENASDGVSAPLIYMLLFGALGGFFYKAVNTMDSMIGYKNDKYLYLGRVAARCDDILNFIPSRVTAVFMIISAALLKMDHKNAFYIFKRDRHNHKSPNAAQTESVCAGALGVRLAGDAYYFGKLYKKPFIGDNKRKIEDFDIVRVNRLMYLSSVLIFLWGILICLFMILKG